MLFPWLLAALLFFPVFTYSAVDEKCESALKTLFSENVSKDQASDFLKIQGDLTLHRLAWAYLKAQKSDESDRLENVERTILTLLDEKYTSTDEDFRRARDQFEAQPLSRTALAEVGGFLKEVLAQEFGAEAEAFILNSSDLKLLHALATHEKKTANNGIFESRMLAQHSGQGMLNFAKLINSSYKVSRDSEEEALGVELKLQGLEKTIGQLQKKISDFIDTLPLPPACVSENDCDINQPTLAEFFNQQQDVQNIFWEALSEDLGSDDLLLDNLTYGEIWLKTGPMAKKSDVQRNPALVTEKTKGKEPSFALGAPVTRAIIAGKTKLSVTSPVKKFYSSSTGLYIENPISVILKDDPRRKEDAWKGFDPVFLGKMADAILNDDKTFEIDGKIYDRRNGRSLSVDQALKFLPPAKASSVKTELLSEDQRFLLKNHPKSFPSIHQLDNKIKNARQLSAIINGDKTYVFEGKIFDIHGKALDPTLIIAEEMSRNTGKPHYSNRYKGLSNGYLIARANALKNDKKNFIIGHQTFDTQTGRNLSSPFRSLAITENSKIQKHNRITYQSLSDKETIINFHREKIKKDGCQNYAIVDKKNAEISVYDTSGVKLLSKEVLVGAKSSDMKTKWTKYKDEVKESSYTTGAGAFVVDQPKKANYYSRKFSNNILQIKGQGVFAIHQVPNDLKERYQRFGSADPRDRRVTGGCVNMKQSDFLELAEFLKPSCQVYVLPEEVHNKFAVKDGQLKFISTASLSMNQRADYNYSPLGSQYRDISIRITDAKGRTKFSEPFVKALDAEKKKLMKVLNLSNDEYNDLALVAYGIMGQESSFGTSPKLWYKELNQEQVIAAKIAKKIVSMKNPFDNDVLNSSRGYTQIKDLPRGPWKKAYPEINKDTLTNPRHSAVATMAYLADAVNVLKEAAAQNTQKRNTKTRITKENMIDYLAYVYQGNRKSLTSSSSPATPDFNKYVQNLRRNMTYLEISQKIE